MLGIILLSVGHHGFGADYVHDLCDFRGRERRVHRYGDGTEHLQTEKSEDPIRRISAHNKHVIASLNARGGEVCGERQRNMV